MNTRPWNSPGVLMPIAAWVLWLVWAAPGAAQEPDMLASSNPTGVFEGRALVTDGSAPRAYGTSANTWYTLSAWDALPIDSTFTYNYVNTASYGQMIARSNATGSWHINLPFHLPAGASVTQVEVNYCDTGDAIFYAFLVRQPKNAVGAWTTLVMSSGTPGCVVETATLTTPMTVDNDTNAYYIQVNMGNLTDNSILFGSVRVGYHLQVSPAPGVATFGDVPTTHPFFRFVEALYASGITAGCGGGNFCPDTAVTRGQMAVFLASALGLHWPN